MEKIIGIFDEQTTYAERLKRYINEKKDLGCYAVMFQSEGELMEFCERKKAVSLITGEQTARELYEHGITLPMGVHHWILTEHAEEEGNRRLFRFQKAGTLIQQLLAEEAEQIQALGALYTVFSPESNVFAFTYAKSLSEKLSKKGKTLLLPWDAFFGYGRAGKTEGAGPSVSELLYLLRKDKEQARRLFENLPRQNGAEYFCGPDYCTDLWQYSAEEMRQLILESQKFGGYRHILFVAGVFHEGVLAVMGQSGKVYMVCSKTEEGEARKQEFYRQMKYAGEQEILSRLTEAEEVHTQ